MDPWIIVGLGNPGDQYEDTRHNAGFLSVEVLREWHQFSAFSVRGKVVLSEGKIENVPVFLVKPLTYMNASGEGVGPLVRFYKVPLERVIVIHDDLELPCGVVRMKRDGGSGGHNGIRSLDAHIGKDYWRIRIGIDRPVAKFLVSSYVLQSFSKDQMNKIKAVFEKIADAIGFFLIGNVEAFSQRISS